MYETNKCPIQDRNANKLISNHSNHEVKKMTANEIARVKSIIKANQEYKSFEPNEHFSPFYIERPNTQCDLEK